MRISIDISMYPLKEEYKPSIIRFIEALRQREDIVIETNGMSSQIYGEYDAIMRVMDEEVREVMMGSDKVSMVMKWVNDDLQGPVKF